MEDGRGLEGPGGHPWLPWIREGEKGGTQDAPTVVTSTPGRSQYRTLGLDLRLGTGPQELNPGRDGTVGRRKCGGHPERSTETRGGRTKVGV